MKRDAHSILGLRRALAREKFLCDVGVIPGFSGAAPLAGRRGVFNSAVSSPYL
jgi:hypothetical protein